MENICFHPAWTTIRDLVSLPIKTFTKWSKRTSPERAVLYANSRGQQLLPHETMKCLHILYLTIQDGKMCIFFVLQLSVDIIKRLLLKNHKYVWGYVVFCKDNSSTSVFHSPLGSTIPAKRTLFKTTFLVFVTSFMLQPTDIPLRSATLVSKLIQLTFCWPLTCRSVWCKMDLFLWKVRRFVVCIN